MVVTYGVLLLVILLAQVAAVITGFVMKDTFTNAIKDEMKNELVNYKPKDLGGGVWNETQKSFECCGTTNYTSWMMNDLMNSTRSLPDSCCVNFTENCGYQILDDSPDSFYHNGCDTEIVSLLKKYLIAVGAVAAAVGILEILGIIFAFCLANCLRKDYRVV